MANAEDNELKYGVRASKISEGTLLIQQTVKSGKRSTDGYGIDGQKERRVRIDDDLAIGAAVRSGVAGRLKAKRT